MHWLQVKVESWPIYQMVTSKNISIMKMLPGAVRDKRNCWSCMHKWKLWKANPSSTWQFVITCISRNTTMRVKNVHVCLIVGWRLEISHYHYLQKQRQITFKKMPWNSINMTTILLKEILCYLENANCTYNTMNVNHSVKSVRIRSYSSSYFSAFRPNTERYPYLSGFGPNAGKSGPE